MAKLESKFQSELIAEIQERLPGCYAFKAETYVQGFPDIFVLYGNKWAALECKRSGTAKHQPNQDYYVGRMNELSFARFICPENKEEVLRELERSFEP